MLCAAYYIHLETTSGAEEYTLTSPINALMNRTALGIKQQHTKATCMHTREFQCVCGGRDLGADEEC